MKRTLLIASILIVLSGCSWEVATERINTGTTVMEKSEPVVSALEDATGRTIPAAVSSKGERIATTVKTIAETGAGITGGLGLAPVSGALAAIAGLAGAVATWFRNRQKKTEKGLDVVLKAVTKEPDIGKTIVKAAVKAGVADLIEERYQEAVVKSP